MHLVPLLLAAVPFLAPAEEDFDGNKLVQVSLLADREALRPGGTATLAVRYKIEKDWHVYWENPGDSGLKTRATFRLPTGWKVGEVRFPFPERHASEGDIVTFVFHGELVLLAELSVPEDAAIGERVTIEVEGSWLVCRELCVPGKGQARLELAVAAQEQPANAALFAAARARMPKPWSELSKARVSWGGTLLEPRLTLVVPGAKKLEWFPLDVEPVKLVTASVDVGKQGATLRAGYEFDRRAESDEPRIRGVLVVTTEAGVASYRLDHLYSPPPAGG
ncbi:MAG: protein-disulfide reductase DsbD N-terminal domain-containing protein [Planctomycetes bacterium]|nr:protein-disulfide reductase DsbD N-terminal domain-containing protein [Planctomycetota bacterium]